MRGIYVVRRLITGTSAWLYYPVGFYCALFVMSSFSVLTSSVWAQDLPPCGVIQSHTTLQHDCRGPMVIEHDRIVVDLGGYTVSSDELTSALEIINRTNVTVKNGRIGGRGGVLIHGGGGHVLSSLTLSVEDGKLLTIQGSRRNIITNIVAYADTDGQGIEIVGKNNILADSVMSSASDSAGSLLFLGSGNKVVRSLFRQVQDSSPIVVESRARVENNTIEFESLSPDIAAIDVKGNAAIVRNNYIKGVTSWEEAAVIAVRVDGSRATIEGNTIEVEAEAAPAYGVLVGSEGRHNRIQRNLIQRRGGMRGAGISVVGQKNQVADNITTSVDVHGTANRIVRNISDTMTDTNPDCATNVWRHNIFTSDSEGDGPETGCIQ